jgi:membrane-associated phospholipid phosphatase
MSFPGAKSLLQSGFGIWLVALGGVTLAVIVCVLWLDRPIALLAYEWFGRHRADGFHPFHGGLDFGSFPSGHTAAICAVAAILWIYLPMYRALYTAGVAAISILLLAGDFHFLSDVIAGAFVSVSLAALVLNMWEHRIRCGLMHLNRHLPGFDVPASIDCMRQ